MLRGSKLNRTCYWHLLMRDWRSNLFRFASSTKASRAKFSHSGIQCDGYAGGNGQRENVMSDINKASSRREWWRIPLRVLLILMLATVVGWTLNRMARSMERNPRPA